MWQWIDLGRSRRKGRIDFLAHSAWVSVFTCPWAHVVAVLPVGVGQELNGFFPHSFPARTGEGFKECGSWNAYPGIQVRVDLMVLHMGVVPLIQNTPFKIVSSFNRRTTIMGFLWIWTPVSVQRKSLWAIYLPIILLLILIHLFAEFCTSWKYFNWGRIPRVILFLSR